MSEDAVQVEPETPPSDVVELERRAAAAEARAETLDSILRRPPPAVVPQPAPAPTPPAELVSPIDDVGKFQGGLKAILDDHATKMRAEMAAQAAAQQEAQQIQTLWNDLRVEHPDLTTAELEDTWAGAFARVTGGRLAGKDIAVVKQQVLERVQRAAKAVAKPASPPNRTSGVRGGSGTPPPKPPNDRPDPNAEENLLDMVDEIHIIQAATDYYKGEPLPERTAAKLRARAGR